MNNPKYPQYMFCRNLTGNVAKLNVYKRRHSDAIVKKFSDVSNPHQMYMYTEDFFRLLKINKNDILL